VRAKKHQPHHDSPTHNQHQDDSTLAHTRRLAMRFLAMVIVSATRGRHGFKGDLGQKSAEFQPNSMNPTE